jgi:predicted RNA-binding Zn-ribbon protein involved in translation (DUF1610 family)
MSRRRKLSQELKTFLVDNSNTEINKLQSNPLFKNIISKLREYEDFIENVIIDDDIEELLKAYSAIEQKLVSSTIRYADITSDDIVIQCYDELKLIYDFIQSRATWIVTDIHVDEFTCPKCGAEIVAEKSDRRYHKFCSYCGTRLAYEDFIAEDEEKLKTFGYID